MIRSAFRSGLLALGIVTSTVVFNSPTLAQPAEVRMSGDDINTVFGLPWAANDWPFSQVIEVQRNSIDPTLVGRIIFDRHGLDTNPLIQAPFAAPRPGRVVLISAWGSSDAGCYAELVIQSAVEGNQPGSSINIPTQIDMNVGGQVITLQAQADSAQYSNARSFQYSETVWNDARDEYVSVDRSGVWYTARHLFRISEQAASVLSSAPNANVPIRVTLSNRQPFTYEIGSGTAQRWRSVFSHNPSCAGSSSRSVAATSNAPASQPQQPRYLLREQGTLTAGDPTLSDGSLYQTFQFQGRAGQTVRISLQSSDFDTYLVLGDAQGNPIARNDDISPNNRNSAITYTLPQDGTYFVLVNAYDSTGRGQFLLTIE